MFTIELAGFLLANLSDSCFHAGAMALQWPHHGAKNFTNVLVDSTWPANEEDVSFSGSAAAPVASRHRAATSFIILLGFELTDYRYARGS